ncbi:MAG: M61 family peptidase [Leptospira sp.]|nr:M61 family peptidase [Leptospira sp.]
MHYSVQILDIHKHYYEVTLNLQAIGEYTNLLMPTWTPGSYMIRDYSTHLHQFSAKDSITGKDLNWEQVHLHKWKIKNESPNIKIRYIIYAFEDYTVRTNYLVKDFGFINPPALFLYLENKLDTQITIKFDVNEFFSNIYTSLKKTANENEFFAINIDELYDSPIHLSNQNSILFETENCQHEMVVEGNIPYNFKEKLANDLKIITSKQISWMGNSPNDYYLFVVNLSQPSYGGLEHKASSINFFSPELINDEEEYKKLLELLSHEYFHLWNIKRIRPIALGPFDYQNPNLTKELWIAEGATSFYDIYFLYQSNFLSKDEFVVRLQSDIFSLDETIAENLMSLEDSSFTAWTKYYKRNGNSHNLTVSYYTKGAVLILCMILYILRKSEGNKSFRDIMQLLYTKYHIQKNRGFTKQEFFDTAKEATGIDLKTEFDPYLIKPIKIPVDDYLESIGLFRIESDISPDLKFKVKEKNGNLYVNKILFSDDETSFDLQLDDELIAMNGKRINKSMFDRAEKMLQPKERVHFLISRFGHTKEIMLEVGFCYKNKKLSFIDEPNESQKKLQDIFFLKI